MKFKYRQLSLQVPFSGKGYLHRPIIPVSLKNKALSLRYEALIDSGADFCIFPTEIARKLKINLNKSKQIYFSGTTGELVKGVIGDVNLDIGEGGFKIKVVFADLAGNVGILGQYGFFDKFIVKFDMIKKEIELNLRIR